MAWGFAFALQGHTDGRSNYQSKYLYEYMIIANLSATRIPQGDDCPPTVRIIPYTEYKIIEESKLSVVIKTD